MLLKARRKWAACGTGTWAGFRRLGRNPSVRGVGEEVNGEVLLEGDAGGNESLFVIGSCFGEEFAFAGPAGKQVEGETVGEWTVRTY